MWCNVERHAKALLGLVCPLLSLARRSHHSLKHQGGDLLCGWVECLNIKLVIHLPLSVVASSLHKAASVECDSCFLRHYPNTDVVEHQVDDGPVDEYGEGSPFDVSQESLQFLDGRVDSLFRSQG